MDEIFGKQDGSCKFYELVDRDSEAEFDMLQNLQGAWEERESRSDGTQSFFEWFKNNKVTHYDFIFSKLTFFVFLEVDENEGKRHNENYAEILLSVCYSSLSHAGMWLPTLVLQTLMRGKIWNKFSNQYVDASSMAQ